jgi:hypothetical protein
MPRVPVDFEEEFEAKGDRFFALAELLYSTPDRRYTRDELADRFDCSTTTIDNHTGEMSEWLDRRDGQTTYAWDTDAHDPASTEGFAAVKQFYVDLWRLLLKHSNTAPGTFALLGFVMLLAGAVVFAFYVGLSLGITRDSAIPVVVYLVIAGGSFLTGIVVTLLSPFQAVVNRFLWPRLPEPPFRKGD